MDNSMKKFTYIVILFLILLCIPGCINIFNPELLIISAMRTDPLKGITENYVKENIKIGITTEQQIVSMLGKPVSTRKRQDEIEYSYGGSHTKYGISVNQYELVHSLDVYFDSNNIVKKYEYTEMNVQDINIHVHLIMPDPTEQQLPPSKRNKGNSLPEDQLPPSKRSSANS